MIRNFIEKIPRHRKGLIYISLCAFLWSSSGLFIKVLQVSAFHISFYRSAIAALTITAVTLYRHKKIKFELDSLSLLASFFYAGILILFVIATKMTTAANAIFLQFTAPIYLLVLEPVFLKTKFEIKNLVTIIFCIGGMVLFFFGRLELGNVYGNLVAICSGICFAMFTLLLRYKRIKHKSVNTLGSVILGNLLVAVISFFIIYPEFSLSSTETTILIYIGMIQIGISYIIFNAGIKYVTATESMIIAMMEAIFNPVWVFIGIGEVPSVYAIIGGSIIFGAILWRTLNVRSALIIEN